MADIPTSGSGSPAGGSGLEPNVASLLAYLCSPVSAIVFLLIEKNNKTVRFHAWHSIFLFGFLFAASLAYMILSYILAFVPIIGFIFWILGLMVFCIGMPVLAIVLMVKAYQGSHLELPVLSDLARKQVAKEG